MACKSATSVACLNILGCSSLPPTAKRCSKALALLGLKPSPAVSVASHKNTVLGQRWPRDCKPAQHTHAG